MSGASSKGYASIADALGISVATSVSAKAVRESFAEVHGEALVGDAVASGTSNLRMDVKGRGMGSMLGVSFNIHGSSSSISRHRLALTVQRRVLGGGGGGMNGTSTRFLDRHSIGELHNPSRGREEYSMTFAQQLLAYHGPAAIVAQLRQGVQHSLRHHTEERLCALVYCTTRGDGLTAFHAGAADVIADAMRNWARDHTLLGIALVAAYHTGRYGVAPALLDAVLGCLERHSGRRLLSQAAVRMLRCYPDKLDQSPRVAAVMASVMCKYRRDDPIQLYGAFVWIGLLGLEPTDVANAFGASAVFTINECAVQVMAGVTYHVVQIHGEPWHSHLLTELFPRLRSRG